MLILTRLFYIFFKVGLFAFGGGYVILPLIYQEIEKFGMMTSAEFSDIVALSQMTPGPISINAATYVGYKAAGIAGSAVATVGVVLPCLIISLLIITFLVKFKTSPAIKSILVGIRPATAGMLLAAVIFFSENSIFKNGVFTSAAFSNPFDFISLPSVAIFALTIICSVKFKLGPVLLTVLAGIAGLLIF
ncbi:MAG: chromate transporter [Clostridiales bacterium]|nr:chromate transporter [Clostridiales bacterium]